MKTTGHLIPDVRAALRRGDCDQARMLVGDAQRGRLTVRQQTTVRRLLQTAARCEIKHGGVGRVRARRARPLGGFTVRREGPGGRSFYARGLDATGPDWTDKVAQATDYSRDDLRRVLNAIDTDGVRVYEDDEPVHPAVWERIRDPDFRLDPDEAAEPPAPRRAAPVRARRRR